MLLWHLYFAFMLFTVVHKDLTIFHLPSGLWAHKMWRYCEDIAHQGQVTSCLSMLILLFSLMIEMQVVAARCLHFPASLIVMCGHMIKFPQIEGGHNWWMALLFLLPLLASWTNCDPVSTRHRVDGKASPGMAEGEGRNLGFRMIKWSRATHQPEPFLQVLPE